MVTTGGQPTESIPVGIPDNARVTAFLPYEQVLPKVDLLITNGGYGTVNMALAHGIPIVSAGLTEDKEEVSAIVQWSGAGRGNWQKSLRDMTRRRNCSVSSSTRIRYQLSQKIRS